jgi:7,8-dihydro-6-hydroxymethylpterin dimethyltransferase
MPSPLTTPARVDRDEVFLEYTKSICPICKVVVDAEINVRDNKVYLRKRCRDHGSFEALVYGDTEMYAASMRFNKPGTLPLRTQTEVHDGCPLDCGLCPDHKQHACVGLIEVNTACNLDCPVCFADSGHHPDGFSLTREQVEAGLDAFVAAEGEPEVVMFSGGEPSIHPQILESCALARDKGIRDVVLNTNGIRLARDRRFGPALAELGVRIYLQFDGLEEATHLALRGRDLRAAKAKALERCAEAGLAALLVAAVEAGVNDHELGAIVRHGIEHPVVRGVVFQPVTHAGRHVTFDPRRRLTNPDVIHGLVDRCPDWFRVSDFFPVPCCVGPEPADAHAAHLDLVVAEQWHDDIALLTAARAFHGCLLPGGSDDVLAARRQCRAATDQTGTSVIPGAHEPATGSVLISVVDML